MWQILLAEILVEGAQLLGLPLLEGTAPGFGGEAYDSIDMLGFGDEEFLLEFGGPALDRLTQGLEGVGIGVLRGELVQSVERLDQLKSVLAHEMELRPEALQFGRGRLVQHQPPQDVVLAVKQGQGDDFVDRHHAGITERDGEHLAEFLGRTEQLLPGLATFRRQQRRGEAHRALAIAPEAPFLLVDRCLRRDQRKLRGRRGGQHPRLQAGPLTGILSQAALDQEFGSLGQSARQRHLNDPAGGVRRQGDGDVGLTLHHHARLTPGEFGRRPIGAQGERDQVSLGRGAPGDRHPKVLGGDDRIHR